MRNILRFIWRIITAPFRWFSRKISDVRSFLTEEPDDTPIGDFLVKLLKIPMRFYTISMTSENTFSAQQAFSRLQPFFPLHLLLKSSICWPNQSAEWKSL